MRTHRRHIDRRTQGRVTKNLIDSVQIKSPNLDTDLTTSHSTLGRVSRYHMHFSFVVIERKYEFMKIKVRGRASRRESSLPPAPRSGDAMAAVETPLPRPSAIAAHA